MDCYLLENFLPDVIGPVGGYWGKEEGLEFNVAKNEDAMHPDAGSRRSFAVEISGAGKVVKS